MGRTRARLTAERVAGSMSFASWASRPGRPTYTALSFEAGSSGSRLTPRTMGSPGPSFFTTIAPGERRDSLNFQSTF